MNSEKQKNFLIQFLYYLVILVVGIFFFRYVFYILLPFIIGFAIAFLLHPIIVRLSKYGHVKFYSTVVILTFYLLIACLLTWISIKGFYYIQAWTYKLPLLYEQYIAPNLHSSLSSVERVWKSVDVDSAQIVTSILQSLQNSLLSLVNNISKSVLTCITNIMSSIPKTILSFFFAIVSSFFINADYAHIVSFLKHTLPNHVQHYVNSTQKFIRTTLKQLLHAYAKLLCLTFVELCIGLYMLGVEHSLYIALGIALFDIIPVLGTGGILLPWIGICFLNQHTKLAVGLLILYLIITIVRNIIEPKIVGKQVGLHPLLMLLCMYLGGKILGPLGIFLLPILLLIAKHLWNEKKKEPNIPS